MDVFVDTCILHKMDSIVITIIIKAVLVLPLPFPASPLPAATPLPFSKNHSTVFTIAIKVLPQAMQFYYDIYKHLSLTI
jgi:hypothetical protein